MRQGYGAWVGDGAASGQVQRDGQNPKRMLGMVQQAVSILIFHCLAPLIVPLCGECLELFQLIGAQANPFSFKVSGWDLLGCGLRGVGGGRT